MTLQTTTPDDARQVALLKAVGLDKVAPEQRELALAIAGRYDLDMMLRHMVMIEGRPYITRDGLLHVAHKSGKLDGIETTDPESDGKFWRAKASVYRKDMTRPFTYSGRYPVDGSNKKFGPEMALKVAEVMALRRAFDIAAPVAEERWDVDQGPGSPYDSGPEPASLADKIAARAEAVVSPLREPEGATEGDVVVEVESSVLGTSETVLAAPMDESTSAALPIVGVSDDGDEPLTVETFAELMKGYDRKVVKETAKRLFPDAKQFSQLTSDQLALVVDEVVASQDPTPPETTTTTSGTPSTVTTPPATSTGAERPSVANGGIELCGDLSPLSGNTCTLDLGHAGKVHRFGLGESW